MAGFSWYADRFRPLELKIPPAQPSHKQLETDRFI